MLDPIQHQVLFNSVFGRIPMIVFDKRHHLPPLGLPELVLVHISKIIVILRPSLRDKEIRTELPYGTQEPSHSQIL